MNAKIREYSLPLLMGVLIALIWANTSPESYNHVIFTPIFGEEINAHWLIENIFMVFFFATAMVEIVNSLSPGGALNPIKKAINPILATFGGVLGPIGVYFVLNALIGQGDFSNGWGICTATDIAISWLAARIIFGAHHPATSFLLLLAVADDAIGLVIIAIFYPSDTPQPVWLLLCVAGMIIGYLFQKKGINSMLPYIIICGGICWVGMYLANISPALSLVLVVPFFPRDRKGVVAHEDSHGVDDASGDTTLSRFEQKVGPFVDYGLIFFGVANAGVEFSNMSTLTLIVAVSTILGKTLGIFLLSEGARLGGFPRPDGMGVKETLVAAINGGMGLTVALFVANAAFTDGGLLGASKMGALFTVGAFIIAFVTAKMLGVKRMKN